CPPGWGFPFSDTVKIGELAVATGLNVLYEVENGVFRLTAASETLARKGTLKPVPEYIQKQSRFRNMTETEINELQQRVEERWRHYLARASNL
ncbi:MAG: pyruvate ferredoxin oxidoreductase, partial [Dehalococcoidales bacterium]|nr:pyruvate ferredoxin oxidoreductase [Dehalococcoidales bacterium]